MKFDRFTLLVAGAALAATSSVAVAEGPIPSGLTRPAQRWKPLQDATPPRAIVDAVSTRGGKVASAKSQSLISQPASILMGCILALNSGFINGCALSGAVAADGSSQAVAAVTASLTNSALGQAASGDSDKFTFLAKILLSFISGSFVAGFLQPTPTPFQVSSSSFGLPLMMAAGCTLLAKKYLEDSSSVKLGFCLLAAANGINNSVTSTMTSNLCRTSHFTGISSDIGTFLGQVLRGNQANRFKLQVFLGLAACFWAGGYLSYDLSKEYGTSILYVSAAVYLLMAGVYDKVAKVMFA